MLAWLRWLQISPVKDRFVPWVPCRTAKQNNTKCPPSEQTSVSSTCGRSPCRPTCSTSLVVVGRGSQSLSYQPALELVPQQFLEGGMPILGWQRSKKAEKKAGNQLDLPRLGCSPAALCVLRPLSFHCSTQLKGGRLLLSCIQVFVIVPTKQGG